MRLGALFAFVVLALAGCSGLKADPQREAQADKALEQVIRGDQAGLLAQAHASIDPRAIPALFAEMQRQLPKSAPPPGKTVTWTHMAGNPPQYHLERQYDFPEAIIVTRTIMVREGDRWLVAGFHFNGMTRAEFETVKFGLTGKNPIHYAVLASAVAVPVFILVTVGWALYRRRWLWAVGALFGVGALQLNWATGGWSVSPIFFSLLGAGVMKVGSVFAPWMVTVGLPLPAILFWSLGKHRPKPKKAKRSSGPAPGEAEPESPT